MAALTDLEFNITYNRALQRFGKATLDELNGDIFGMNKPCSKHRSEVLWLYSYALNSWDTTPGAINFLTEAQMLAIAHKVQTLV